MLQAVRSPSCGTLACFKFSAATGGILWLRIFPTSTDGDSRAEPANTFLKGVECRDCDDSISGDWRGQRAAHGVPDVLSRPGSGQRHQTERSSAAQAFGKRLAAARRRTTIFQVRPRGQPNNGDDERKYPSGIGEYHQGLPADHFVRRNHSVGLCKLPGCGEQRGSVRISTSYAGRHGTAGRSQGGLAYDLET